MLPVISMFTKMFGGDGPETVGPQLHEMGFSAVDLLVRPGSTCDPNRLESVTTAVKWFRSDGFTVPLVTTDVTRVDDESEGLLNAIADSGVNQIRLGYFSFIEGRPFQAQIDAARSCLETLEGVARRLGVRLLLQLHGGTLHASGASTRTLLTDRDPAWIGAYVDPGNQAVQDGREDWRYTFATLAPYVTCLGVKNGVWSSDSAGAWQSRWTALDQGMVPWQEILPSLPTTVGLLSLHSHYELPLEAAKVQTEKDLIYVKQVLADQGEVHE